MDQFEITRAICILSGYSAANLYIHVQVRVICPVSLVQPSHSQSQRQASNQLMCYYQASLYLVFLDIILLHTNKEFVWIEYDATHKCIKSNCQQLLLLKFVFSVSLYYGLETIYPTALSQHILQHLQPMLTLNFETSQIFSSLEVISIFILLHDKLCRLEYQCLNMDTGHHRQIISLNFTFFSPIEIGREYPILPRTLYEELCKRSGAYPQ